MDDMLDKKDDTPVGGPHPHAGFETVSLLIEGEMGEMKAGDLQMMTAGSGVVHTETIDKPTKMRLFQLWLNLPRKTGGHRHVCRISGLNTFRTFQKMALTSVCIVVILQVSALPCKTIHQ